MKTLYVLLLLIAAACHSAERSRPVLFVYDPSLKAHAGEEAEAEPSVLSRYIDLDRLDLGKIRTKRAHTWIDDSPVVIWGSSFKKGLYVLRIKDGHISFLSTRKRSQIIRLEKRW